MQNQFLNDPSLAADRKLLYYRFADWVITASDYSQDKNRLRRARLTLIFTIALAFWSPCFAAFYHFVLHSVEGTLTVVLAGIFALLTPLILRVTKSPAIAGNFLTLILFWVVATASYIGGGYGGPPPVWTVAVPMIVVTLAGRTSGLFWLVCSFILLFAFYKMDLFWDTGLLRAPSGAMQLFILMTLGSLLVLIASLSLVFSSATETAIHDLEAAQGQLVQSGKMSVLGEMAGGIAHEINNPLALIHMSASQLQDLFADEKPEKLLIEERLVTIQETVGRIARIVSSLRDFSRDGSRDEKQPEPLGAIVENSINLCSEKIKLDGIRLVVECRESKVLIMCRWVEVSQILLNLLSNARDATAGAAQKWIRLSCAESETDVEIRIENSGSTIPAELREKIFQPFFTTKDIGKGTGLGLSISRSFAEGNGGSLTLDTHTDHTCFVLRLPKAKRTAGGETLI